MKKLFIPVLAAFVALAASAFTKPVTGYFYVYSGDFSQTSIENPSNYVRANVSCSGGANVCGVTLPTDEGLGNHPLTSDFNNEKSNLWTSQQNGSAADGNIKMEN